MADKQSLRKAYGEALVELAGKNKKIVVMDADLSTATMTKTFKEKYPDRFFDFGIAENNMVCAASGFAHSDLIPFVSTFAIFGAGRSFEMIRNSVSYVNANVKIACTHAGISVGEDGGSHQSIEDIALMRVLPGMTIFVPCDALEVKKAVKAATEINGPVYIRIARPVSDVITTKDSKFVPGQANVIKDGKDICLMATGLMVNEALKAANSLRDKGISAAVLNFHTIKPFDTETALRFAGKCGAVLSVEEHSVIGGLGSAIAETLAGHSNAKFDRIGINDCFGQSGAPDQLFEEYGIDAKSIVKRAVNLLN